MKSLKNDYCIKMFADSGNNSRPQMNEIHLENGFLYASDLHMAAKVNADICVKKYKSIEKYPNVEELISEHNSDETKIFKVNTLFNELMKRECCFKQKFIDCSECDGTGTKICECCDSEYDCVNCMGEGIIAGEKLELTSKHHCKLFNKKYNLRHLDIILKTAIILSVDDIEISNAEKSGTIFKVGDFTILLMPVFN